MATLRTTIPDDLSRQVRAMARARGVPVQLLVEEALRSLVSPEPFSGEAEALAEMEVFEAEILRDTPWER
jgi:16S rRNA U516 pseudouridylate synthase RsuA-like enzyme